MRISDITDALEHVAPLSLQENYDNSGYQVGIKSNEATAALFCIDVTEAVVDEAISLGANLIVSHHPLLFNGLKSITGKDYIERVVIKAIKADIAIYAAHTNMDNARHGVNYKIAEKLGLIHLEPLAPLDNDNSIEQQHGSGVVGTLPSPMSEQEFLIHVKAKFEVPSIKFSPSNGKLIERIALCGGSGSFLTSCAIAKKADAFITGEIKYHDYFAFENQILMIEAGHYETEQFTKEIFYEIITKKFPTFVTYYTEIETNPINYL